MRHWRGACPLVAVWTAFFTPEAAPHQQYAPGGAQELEPLASDLLGWSLQARVPYQIFIRSDIHIHWSKQKMYTRTNEIASIPQCSHGMPLRVQAYNILRRSSGLLLSLVHLMARASITDLKADPNKALLKLQV